MSYNYNRIINYSNPKSRKQITIKNMHGMYDPAFQSNNTLKEYINKKLTLYKTLSDYNTNPNPDNILKSKEKRPKKKLQNLIQRINPIIRKKYSKKIIKMYYQMKYLKKEEFQKQQNYLLVINVVKLLKMLMKKK